jgi:RNA polymerase sigma factor (sigma-70 family)
MQSLRLRSSTASDVSGSPLKQREETHDAVAIMERLVRGEQAALDDLLQAYWGPVVAYVTRAFGLTDGNFAHDVAQEAFLKVWERRDWRGGSVRAYLFRIARNLYLDEIRRTSARERAEVKSDVAEGRSPRTPDRILEETELIERVHEVVQGMSERRREAFSLVYLQGLSYREAAGVMDVSEKTVGNHLTAALGELRMRLGNFF